MKNKYNESNLTTIKIPKSRKPKPQNDSKPAQTHENLKNLRQLIFASPPVLT